MEREPRRINASETHHYERDARNDAVDEQDTTPILEGDGNEPLHRR